MIKRVRLKNWRSHYDTDLRFDEGTNVIIGINGAGKSSVLEAIFFALFGPPERGYYERVLREGASEGAVELVFEVDGKEYSVKRVFTAKGQKLTELRGAKTIITERAKDVDGEIVKILGMDQKLFKEAVYARQNEMAYILRDASPQERKRLFDDLIELGEFSTAKQVVTRVRNRIKRELDIFRSQNWGEVQKRAEETLRDLERRKSAILAQIREMEEKLSGAREKLELLKQRSEKLKNLVEELSSTKEEVARKKGAIREKESILKKIEEKWGEVSEASEEDLQRLDAQIKQAEELQRTLAALKKEEQLLSEQVRSLEEKIASAPTAAPDIRAIQKEMDETDKKLKAAQERLKQADIRIASLHEQEKRISERVSALEKELEQANQIATQMRELVSKYGDVERRLSQLREEMQEITARIARNNAKIEQEKTFIESLRGASRCPVCGSELNAQKTQVLIAEHERTLSEAEESAKQLKQRLEQIKQVIKELENANKRLQELKQNIRSPEDINGELEEAKKQHMAITEQIKGALAEKEEYESKVKELTKQLDKIKKAYDEAIRAEAAARERARAQEELERLKTKLTGVRKEIGRVGAELSKLNIVALKRERERIEDMIRAAEIQAKLLVERGELRTLEEKLKELSPSESEYREALAEQKKMEEKINNITSILAEYKNQLAYVEQDIERQKQEIERILKQLQEARRKEELKNALEKMESALAGTQEIVRNARIMAINKVLNIVWREIYVGGDLPEIRLRPTQSDYVLEVKRKSGQWVPVTNLSGGEFYDAAIALRIAISAIKNRKLGWLLLDEPTHNLDSESAQALAAFLNKLPETGLFRQIIVITHDETFRVAATGTTYVFTRDKAKGSPTKWEVIGA